MSRPDDSFLTPHQLANVRRHADRLLCEAAASGRFPTPIDDLMKAAKVTIVDDAVLNESFLRRIASKAASGLETIKSALSKVLGLFEAKDRIVIIDKNTPRPRIPFVKLHEAGHGSMPHQSKVYTLMHDCEKTLDPEVGDLFEREANVFASEVLFQGNVFYNQASELEFGVKTAMSLAKRFGASNYAAFRRYVATNSQACCLVALEQVKFDEHGAFSAEVRRIVANDSFGQLYCVDALATVVTQDHPLMSLVPLGKKQRMVSAHEVGLIDRNGDWRECVGESFNTGHQILILLRDKKPLNSTVIKPETLKIRPGLSGFQRRF
jgi:Zn-dependent peptidase ImmA (M78 family)